ncbi:hypothetical protein [Engelhardtia mirabilis]|uniref:hypothetical protein n=1 Tax=Engelhardtia mirabilis TaxID=2528011 RepID=UPI003AF351A3
MPHAVDSGAVDSGAVDSGAVDSGAVLGVQVRGVEERSGLSDDLIVSRDHVVNYIASQTTERVYGRLHAAQQRAQRFYGILTVFFGFVGFSAVAALVTTPIAGTLREELKTTVVGPVTATADRAESLAAGAQDASDKVARDLSNYKTESLRQAEAMQTILNEQVHAAVDSNIGGLQRELTARDGLLDLKDMAARLDAVKSFSIEERERVMSAIRVVAASQSVRASAGFSLALEKVVSSFAAADQVDTLAELDELVPEMILSSTLSSGTLATHFGQVMIGSLGDPSTWSVEMEDRFARYANQASDQSILARATLDAIRLIALALRDPNASARNDATRAFLSGASKELPEFQALLVIQLVIYTDSKFWVTTGGTPRTEMIAIRARRVVRANADLLDQLLSPPVLGAIQDQGLTDVMSAPDWNATGGAQIGDSFRLLQQGGFEALAESWGQE